jgi:hypothetical protein
MVLAESKFVVYYKNQKMEILCEVVKSLVLGEKRSKQMIS